MSARSWTWPLCRPVMRAAAHELNFVGVAGKCQRVAGPVCGSGAECSRPVSRAAVFSLKFLESLGSVSLVLDLAVTQALSAVGMSYGR